MQIIGLPVLFSDAPCRHHALIRFAFLTCERAYICEKDCGHWRQLDVIIEIAPPN